MAGFQHFLKSILIVILVKSVAPYFETSSNAAQFRNLENLIGSLHTYASEDSYLFVRDLGLTDGQRLILKRYQNVQVVSPTYNISKTTRLIHVANELISTDDIFAERRANGDLLYVDSIRKRYRLAIVIPFFRSQLDELKAQLHMHDIYVPCRRSYQSVDLILYHNEAVSSSVEMIIRQIKFVKKCYQNVVFLAANLPNHHNSYSSDIAMMWLKLILENNNNRIALRALGYTHFFFMEINTIPIRSFWLDVIVKQVTEGYCQNLYCVTSWWMSGSIYHSPNWIDQCFYNINSNALYHLSSKFVAYVKDISSTYVFQLDQVINYDLTMFLALHNNTYLAKELWHKFRFSDFIQHCEDSNCQGTTQHTKKQFVLNNPHTFLIHSGFSQKNITTKNTHNLQWIIISCISFILIILWWSLLHRRRLKLIRVLHHSCCVIC